MTYEKKFSTRVKVTPRSGIRAIYNIALRIENLINFCIGDPDFDTPKYICEAAKRSIDGGYTHYTPNAGYDDLREAIAEKLARENSIEVDPMKEVLVTAGAQGALALIMFTLLNPGDKVLIPDPGYVSYECQVLMSGANPVFYPLWERNQFMPNPEDIQDKITEETKVIILNSPSNPLGSVINKDCLKTIASIAQEHDLLVVTDEAYEKLIYDGFKHHSIYSFPGMSERTISVFSCSKTYAMTGWRIGYVVGEETVIKEMSKLQEHVYSHPSSISQKAAVTALTESQDFIRETVKEYTNRRELIAEMLNEIEGVHYIKPKGAFYVFPNVEAFGMTSKDLTMYLINEAKIAVIPGSEFGPHGEGHIRISYAVQRDRIEEGINRMKKALNKLK